MAIGKETKTLGINMRREMADEIEKRAKATIGLMGLRRNHEARKTTDD